MAKFVYILLVALSGLWLSIPSANAESNAPAADTLVLKPVMIIRFNQPTVDFQAQLNDVIQQAGTLKKDVAFDVIQYVPPNSAPTQYDNNLRLVLSEFASNGLNASRVNAIMQSSPDVITDEVYIYAR